MFLIVNDQCEYCFDTFSLRIVVQYRASLGVPILVYRHDCTLGMALYGKGSDLQPGTLSQETDQSMLVEFTVF